MTTQNIPISELPLAVALDGSEEVPIVQAGVTKRTTAAEIASKVIGYVPATRRINTGMGLAGGGSLETDLNLSWAPTELVETPMVAADQFMIIRDQTGDPQKANFQDAMAAIPGLPTMIVPPNPTTDWLIINDATDGAAYKVNVSTLSLAFGNLPAGGTTGQTLVKQSNVDFDTAWTSNLTASSLVIGGATLGTNILAVGVNGQDTRAAFFGSVGNLVRPSVGKGIVGIGANPLAGNALYVQAIGETITSGEVVATQSIAQNTPTGPVESATAAFGELVVGSWSGSFDNSANNALVYAGQYTGRVGGSASVNIVYGTESVSQILTTGTVNQAIATWGHVINQSTATVGTAIGGMFNVGNSGGGTITTAIGVRILNNQGTNGYGLYIDGQTGGTAQNYAIFTGQGLVGFGDKVLAPSLTFTQGATGNLFGPGGFVTVGNGIATATLLVNGQAGQGPLLLNLMSGGVSKLTVDQNGGVGFKTDQVMNNVLIFGTPNQTMRMSGGGGVNFASSLPITWSGTVHAYDATDTRISRIASGVVGIDNGIANQWRDVSARNFIANGGNVTASSGSITAPSFALSNSASTGIYSAGANSIDFANGGVRAHAYSSSVYAMVGSATPAIYFGGGAGPTVPAILRNGTTLKFQLSDNSGASPITAASAAFSASTASTSTMTGALTVAGGVGVGGALNIGTPLAVASGGMGAATHTANTVLLGNGANAVAETAVGTNGQVLTGNTGAAPTFQTQKSDIQYVIDGGGATITTGIKGYVTVPFSCTVTNWAALADQSGSVTVDITSDPYATYGANTSMVGAGAKPNIAAALKNQSAPAGWAATNIPAGNIIGFNVTAASGVQRVVISLTVNRTSA